MKKLIKLLCLGIMFFSLSGCFTDDKLANDDVYTSIYPIQFLTNYLYDENKNIESIYPNGANVFDYKLTDKQKDTYSAGALFVYNGLTSEKEIAKDFLNNNPDILLIDATYKLKYEYSLEELWLCPNNYLKLAKTIKNNLIEYTTSKVITENIEKKYKKLEEDLSFMDADIRSIATESKNEGTNILIVSSNKLGFLEKYGFEIILLDDKNLNEASLKANFKNAKYKDIYLASTDEESNLIKDLKSSYNANVINVNMLYTLTDVQEASNENYLTIMQTFIDNLRGSTLTN